MILYTIGFTKKSARTFFGLIKEHEIGLLIDIRLNNSSQLAGFSKGPDLEFFLEALCGCGYVHDPAFTPTKELMDGYKAGDLTDEQFRSEYRALMEGRGALPHFFARYGSLPRVCLLCSEETPDKCHRGVLADLLQAADPALPVVHL